ncbi:MAG: hypothetical protein OEV80_15250, partial [candidate division Zixibacteria bacterium]|nr:hypothetical protein [candidate division Zixibacteria bacterium]
MHCDQAQRRINELVQAGADPQTDSSLVDHLRDCPRCREEAQAAGLLTQVLRAADEDDTSGITPFHQARQRVEARIASSGDGRAGTDRTAGSFSIVRWWRPARVVYASVALAALLAVALIPFQYDQTIGYAVAFAGVEKELAEDDEAICDLLFDLGLLEANVDVLECDTTC